jgi:glycerophosphoryl diester phosphodiesterase
MDIIGHRGASGHAPENTLKAFALALELGCHWLELDVHWVSDRLLVIHDEALDRTTNGHGLLGDHTLDTLRGFDAGDGERIPFLDEVLELVSGRAVINIELKGAGTAKPVSQLLNTWCIDQQVGTDRFLLSSFNHDELAEADPRFERAALFGRLPDDAVERTLALGAGYLNTSLRSVTKMWVDRAHRSGLRVAVYTVNEPEDIDRMRAWGVDAIFCDYPDRALTASS